MRCETETGAVRDVNSSAELDAVFANMGAEGHIILGDDSNFVQVARGGDSALVEYREGEVMHQAIDPVSLPAAQEMLQAYLRGDAGWKSAVRWEMLREDADSDSIEAGRSRFGGALADEAVRAARRGAGRLVRRGIRRFLG